ncbi:MAG: hypothetical protein HYY93_12260 [Planctomycetes bacterium]|nr:hypothetical protein [Planctomycetota bacterium]
MTIRDLIQSAEPYSLWIAIGFALPPVVAFLAGLLHGAGNGGRPPWKYLYSLLVYLVCFPGICSAVLTGYGLFFTRENLLDVNIAIYIAPVISMVVTLILIRKNVPFDEVPGFDRLSGLMAMIAMTFVFVLAISKTHLGIFFFGSTAMLIALVVGLFAVLKWGTYMLFRGKDEPKIEPPKMPTLPPL